MGKGFIGGNLNGHVGRDIGFKRIPGRVWSKK